MNWIKRLIRWWKTRKMCKCVEPKYEVLQGVLSCSNCNKPAAWEANPNR